MKKSPKKKLAASGEFLLDETYAERFLPQADHHHGEQGMESLTKQLDIALSEMRELERKVFKFEIEITY